MLLQCCVLCEFHHHCFIFTLILLLLLRVCAHALSLVYVSASPDAHLQKNPDCVSTRRDAKVEDCDWSTPIVCLGQSLIRATAKMICGEEVCQVSLWPFDNLESAFPGRGCRVTRSPLWLIRCSDRPPPLANLACASTFGVTTLELQLPLFTVWPE